MNVDKGIKLPLPVFHTTYEQFKTQVGVWAKITATDKSKQGIVIVLNLPQNLKELVLDEISLEQMGRDDGLLKVMSVLDKHFSSQ